MCENDRLLGTLDPADGTAGVLIVSGGNEVRHGAHRGMAMLAQNLALHDVPVFRFDRRGVGDSCGANHGWESSAPDIAAAAAAFRAEQPQIARIIGFGNCDAATALAVFGRAAGVEALVLANPWLGGDDLLPPPAAIRARYGERLRNPGEWLRLLRGGVDIRKLVIGLCKAVQAVPEPPLVPRIAAALADVSVTLVLATGDRTAQMFASCWRGPGFAGIAPHACLFEIDTASHSFVGHAGGLERAILAALTR
jgi:exosortase A-associated hydrolase 1